MARTECPNCAYAVLLLAEVKRRCPEGFMCGNGAVCDWCQGVNAPGYDGRDGLAKINGAAGGCGTDHNALPGSERGAPFESASRGDQEAASGPTNSNDALPERLLSAARQARNVLKSGGIFPPESAIYRDLCAALDGDMSVQIEEPVPPLTGQIPDVCPRRQTCEPATCNYPFCRYPDAVRTVAHLSREEIVAQMRALRQKAIDAGMPLLTLDEINEKSFPQQGSGDRIERLLEALRSCHSLERDRIGKCFACTVLAEHLSSSGDS